MITQRTAERLNKIASEKNISVRVNHSQKPKRSWYSVGKIYDGKWHQITGFTNTKSIEDYISNYGTTK